MKLIYTIYLLSQVYNKIIADTYPQSRKNWEESKFIHMAVNGGGL